MRPTTSPSSAYGLLALLSAVGVAPGSQAKEHCLDYIIGDPRVQYCAQLYVHTTGGDVCPTYDDWDMTYLVRVTENSSCTEIGFNGVQWVAMLDGFSLDGYSTPPSKFGACPTGSCNEGCVMVDTVVDADGLNFDADCLATVEDARYVYIGWD